VGPEQPDPTQDAAQKVTRKLATRLARSKGRPVAGVVYAALDTDTLPLTSFAARAAARDREVQTKLAALLEAIQRWEAQHGQSLPLEVRPDSASIALTAPPEVFTVLAGTSAAAVLDVDPD
jgi:hypothetical protein